MKKLTPEQITEIIRSKEPYLKLAAKYGVTKRTISTYKIEAGASNKKGPAPKITLQQEWEIIKSKLSCAKLAEIYPLSKARISQIRVAAGVQGDKGNRRGETKITAEQMADILNPRLAVKELVSKHNISEGYIYRIRREKGIKNPSTKPPGINYMEKEMKAALSRQKSIVTKKKVDKKVTESKKTMFQVEQERLTEAKKISEQHRMSDIEKIKSGLWHWIPAHIRGRKLVKI